MTIVTQSQNGKSISIEVEVLDTYEAGGVKYAAVKALEGKPFVGGDKWPVRTEFTVVEAAKLINPNGKKPNLLEMALGQAREQWPEATTVWLWGGSKLGVFLKASEGFVTLNITRYEPSLTIWWLDLMTGEWKVARNLEAKYKAWAAKAQEAVK